MKRIPELVAPWWSYSKAMVAASFGADAVYVWVPFTSLRMRQNKIKDFTELGRTIDDLHNLDKMAYLTMNIFPRNQDIKIFEQVLERVLDLKPDAIIFSDPGTYNLIKKYSWNIKLHLSTQTSMLNYESIKFRYDLGVSRVVLARELHISEIAEIKQRIPEMELEVFAHGAMCMSYSGRCLLGEFLAARDGNKWDCPHVCRYKYKVYIQEERRPEQKYEILWDEEWSYILSSKDLCTIHRLEEIVPYVDWLKIEWRSKWEFYVGAAVRAYRHALDAIANSSEINPDIINLVNEIPHRTYRDGFILNPRWTVAEPQTEVSSMTVDTAWPMWGRKYFWLILPQSIEIDGKTYFQMIPKENIKRWDEFKFISKTDIWNIKIIDFLDEYQKNIETINCNMKKVFVQLDKHIEGYTILYI